MIPRANEKCLQEKNFKHAILVAFPIKVPPPAPTLWIYNVCWQEGPTCVLTPMGHVTSSLTYTPRCACLWLASSAEFRRLRVRDLQESRFSLRSLLLGKAAISHFSLFNYWISARCDVGDVVSTFSDIISKLSCSLQWCVKLWITCRLLSFFYSLFRNEMNDGKGRRSKHNIITAVEYIISRVEFRKKPW